MPYPVNMLLVDVDFRQLSRPEARDLSSRFIASIPSRIDLLRSLVRANGVDLEYNEASLVHLQSWCENNIETHVRTEEEIEAVRETIQPHWRHVPIEVEVLSYAGISLAVDACLFVGEYILQKCKGIKWHLSRSTNRNDADYNRTVLGTFNFGINFDPIRVGIVFGGKIVDKSALENELVSMFNNEIRYCPSPTA